MEVTGEALLCGMGLEGRRKVIVMTRRMRKRKARVRFVAMKLRVRLLCQPLKAARDTLDFKRHRVHLQDLESLISEPTSRTHQDLCNIMLQIPCRHIRYHTGLFELIKCLEPRRIWINFL